MVSRFMFPSIKCLRDMPEKGIEVVVCFPEEIATNVQGPVLMTMELLLRTMTSLDVRVVKDLKGDDSKLRRLMTIQQRDKL
jgi:hypothetical protein